MAYFRANDRSDRVKAIVAVAIVHLALGAAILTGLNVRLIAERIDALDTFDVTVVPPPPPPPPLMAQAERAREAEGAAGRKAEPTPIVAPLPKIVVPATPPIPAAPVAGTGSASTSGAATAGTGPGAGGSGSGTGGGGGDFSGYTPARQINNLSNRDYRTIAAGRLRTGSATLAILIDADGLISNCRVARSSGDDVVDRELCSLASRKLRYRPALDGSGRAIPFRWEYVARWSRK